MRFISSMLVAPPASAPWWLRPFIGLARRIAGKELLPAKLLSYSGRLSVGVGIFEALAPVATGQLTSRALAVARIVASAVAGCPFCLDMNAATWSRAGLTADELRRLVAAPTADAAWLGATEALAARYAAALSATPVVLDEALTTKLTRAFEPRELVTLAAAIAQVNFWSRFNQGLGVPPAGFLPPGVCSLPSAAR